MKKLITILSVAALVATSCTGNKETDSSSTVDSTAIADSLAAAQAAADSIAAAEAAAADTSADSSASAFAEGSVDRAIDDFIASEETGTKEFTLDALAGSEDGEGELSEAAKLQLSHIADILAANPDLKAEIQAHGKDKTGVKPATTVRANWVKAKMVVFQEFKGEQLTAKGMGADHLLEGVDPKDDAQKEL